MAEDCVTIRNWRKFQHYKNRCPPWVKLHRSLFTKRKWRELEAPAAKLLIDLWLLASEYRSASIPLPASELAWRLRLDEAEMLQNLLVLQRADFITSYGQPASNLLASCQQLAIPEGEGEKRVSMDVRKDSGVQEDAGKERNKEKLPSVVKRNTLLPESWIPNEGHGQLADKLGVELEGEAEKMRDWAKGGSVKKADWDATFRNWLRNAKPNGNVSSGTEGLEIVGARGRARWQ